MKNVYLLLLVLVGFGLTSCVKDQPSSEGSQDEAVTNTNQAANPLEKLGDGVPFDAEGERVVNNLTNNRYWYVEHWHKQVPGAGKDDAAYTANKARWYQFRKDGTFTHGQLLETMGEGTWTYDSQAKSLKMLSNDKKYNAEFQVDLHSQGGMMSWVSTKRFNSENVMVLLEEYVELMAELP